MADASIIISVQADGTQRVKRELDSVTAAGKQTTNAANLLRSAFLALGGLTLARQLIQTADTFTNIQNKLRLVTDGTNELNSVTKELLDVANRTRSSFTGTAELFVRTANATKAMGLSTQEAIGFTESLNQALTLSGGSAQSQEAALIQLSQSLASGVLRGDEFNSVMENGGRIQTVLTDYLGVTNGELRQMAQDGKLTADVIIEAFRAAKVTLADEFAASIPTIGQAFTVLQNHLVEFIGAFNQTTGASETFAKFILSLSENMATFGHIIGEAAITLGVTLGVVAVSKAITGLQSLYAVMLANPFFALIASVTAIIQWFGGWEVAILSLKATLTASAAGWLEIFNRVGTRIDAWGAGIEAVFERVSSLFKSFAIGLQNFLDDPLAEGNFAGFEANLERGLVGSFRKAFDAVEKEGEQRTDDIKKALDDKLLEIGGKIDEIKNRSYSITGNADLSAAGTKTVKNNGTLSGAAQNIKDTTKEIKAANDASTEFGDKLDEIIGNTDRFNNAVGDAFASFVDGSKSASEALKDVARQLISIASQNLFGGGSSGGLGGILGSVFGSITGGNFFGSQGTAARLLQTGSTSFIGPLPAFADGGSMTIGGNAGVDKNLLSLNNQPIARVGRGENLIIDPNRSGSDSGGGVNVYQTINVSTGVQSTVRAELQRFLPIIEKQTTKAYEEAKMRGAVA